MINNTQRMKIRCPICGSEEIKTEEFGFREINHATFQPAKDGNKTLQIHQCKCCMHIFKIFNKQESDEKNEYMKTKQYESNTSKETNSLAKGSALSKRTRFQAEWISRLEEQNKSKSGGILDYGCNEGDLLKALKEYSGITSREYFGFDVVQRGSFSKKSGDAIFIDNLEGLADGSLDVICISHSLIYEKKPIQAIKTATEKLSDKGFIWFQNPNPKRCSIYLLGDQYNFFQAASSKRLFESFGLNLYELRPEDDSNEMILVASKQETKTLRATKEEFVAIEDIKVEMESIRNRLALQIKTTGSHINIFGRTSSAALICQILGKQAATIVDESKNEYNTFYNKPVINDFNEIGTGNCLIIPMYANTEGLVKRVTEKRPDIHISTIKC